MIAWFAGQPLALKIVLVGIGSLLLVFLLWRLWLRKYLEWQNVRTLEIKERVGLKIEFIKTTAQILGGVIFLITIYVALANLAVSEEKYKTDLFVQAIKQLGDEKIEVRLGGIYALERIARDSEKDHGPIMEVLTAFVREHAKAPTEKPAAAKEEQAESGKVPPSEQQPKTEVEEIKPRADIQAILTVLGRRTRIYKKEGDQRLDLRQTDLRGANLQKAHLEEANLQKAHLGGAKLGGAHLEEASLVGAHLERAHLEEAHLEGAKLGGAHLEEASLQEAHLEKAFLGEAHLEGANLRGAHLEEACLWAAHLEEASLGGAYLKGAKLGGAHLEGAKLGGAHLEGAHLEKAHLEEASLGGAYLKGANLQAADMQKASWLEDYQVQESRNWVLAYLPEELLEKLSLPKDHNQRLRDNNLSGDHFDKLVGLDLRGAIFNRMNLQGANLKEAHLEGAFFYGANLEKAHLEGAKLMGADLREAKGLTQNQIDSAIIDEKTMLPDYLKKADPDKAKPQ